MSATITLTDREARIVMDALNTQAGNAYLYDGDGADEYAIIARIRNAQKG
mgnify:CR=1 FL=1